MTMQRSTDVVPIINYIPTSPPRMLCNFHVSEELSALFQNALNNTVKKGSFIDMWRGSKLTLTTNFRDMTFTDDLSESEANFDHNRRQHFSSTHGSELCFQIWHNLYPKSELGESFCYVMHQLCAQHCCCLLDTVLV